MGALVNPKVSAYRMSTVNEANARLLPDLDRVHQARERQPHQAIRTQVSSAKCSIVAAAGALSAAAHPLHAAFGAGLEPALKPIPGKSVLESFTTDVYNSVGTLAILHCSVFVPPPVAMTPQVAPVSTAACAAALRSAAGDAHADANQRCSSELSQAAHLLFTTGVPWDSKPAQHQPRLFGCHSQGNGCRKALVMGAATDSKLLKARADVHHSAIQARVRMVCAWSLSGRQSMQPSAAWLPPC